MKKTLLFAIALFSVIAVSAQTAAVNIKLTAQNGGSSSVTIVSGITGMRSTYVPSLVNTNNVGLYAEEAGTKYSTYTDNTLANVPLGFYTDANPLAAQNYTVNFALVGGAAMNTETLTFTDLMTGNTFNINSTTPDYNFSVTMANTPSYVAGTHYNVADRFMINYGGYTPDAGTLALCHQYGKLTINNNPYTTNIVIKDDKDVIVKNVAPMNTPQVIDLAGLAAGRYTVEIGTEKMVISIL